MGAEMMRLAALAGFFGASLLWLLALVCGSPRPFLWLCLALAAACFATYAIAAWRQRRAWKAMRERACAKAKGEWR